MRIAAPPGAPTTPARLGCDIPVVLYDGRCPLCVGAVRTVIRADRLAIFKFAALDSETAIQLVHAHGAEPGDRAAALAGETLVLVDREQLFTRSEAALRIAARLRFPWKLAVFLKVVPRRLRDRVYRAVARRRHAVWGRLDSCPVPEPHERDRFI